MTVSVTPVTVCPNDLTPRWEMAWYEYDALNRPLRVCTNRLATTGWDVTSYTYDLPLNQPTRVDLPGETEPVHVYQYSSSGLKAGEDVGLPEQITWTYDAAGRVQQARYSDNTCVEFTYNGDGTSYQTRAELFENSTVPSSRIPPPPPCTRAMTLSTRSGSSPVSQR